MHKLFISILLLTLCPLIAESYNPIEDGKIHEAFLASISGSPILESIQDEPPPEANEKALPETDGLEWVPGYWDWNDDNQDFFWMTGTLRRPPPGHIWIEGKWIQLDEGWIRIPGFWSSESPKELTYIQTTPPDPLEEDVEDPPSDDSFWIPGYWSYDPSSDNFGWVSGKWGIFDENWIFVPAHYVWTENGYALIQSYWDWPLEKRGKAYAPLYVEPAARIRFTFQPEEIVEPLFIVRNHFVDYPNYSYFYSYHYHFHRNIWVDWGFAPAWWSWGYSWGLPWHRQWGLWWWYTHPGYPQPRWLTRDIAHHIGPPPRRLLDRMKRYRPPAIVTPSGVVSGRDIVRANKELFKNRKGPVIPSDKIKRHDLEEKVKPEPIPHKDILTPSPDAKKDKGPIPKPKFPKESVQIHDHETLIKKPQREPPKPSDKGVSSTDKKPKLDLEDLKKRLPSKKEELRKQDEIKKQVKDKIQPEGMQQENLKKLQEQRQQKLKEVQQRRSEQTEPDKQPQLQKLQQQRQQQLQQLQQRRLQQDQPQQDQLQKLQQQRQQQLQQLQQRRLQQSDSNQQQQQRQQQLQQLQQRRLQQSDLDQQQQQRQQQLQQLQQRRLQQSDLDQQQQQRQQQLQQLQQRRLQQSDLDQQQQQQIQQKPIQQTDLDQQQQFQRLQQQRRQQFQELQQRRFQQAQPDQRSQLQRIQQQRQQEFQQLQQRRSQMQQQSQFPKQGMMQQQPQRQQFQQLQQRRQQQSGQLQERRREQLEELRERG